MNEKFKLDEIRTKTGRKVYSIYCGGIFDYNDRMKIKEMIHPKPFQADRIKFKQKSAALHMMTLLILKFGGKS